jgi:ubiquinone/menaquinone biosynthesis C-methylase UbiE
MSRTSLAEQRPVVLSQVPPGDVLEIGFGTGLNLPHYPRHVRRLVVVEPNPGNGRRAARRLKESPLDVRPAALINGRDLPLDANSFDAVVSTWTMCSIADVDHALREIHRVLKPGGRLLFIEHGLSPERNVAAWQRRLNPLMTRLGDGCHLDRDIAGLVSQSPLNVLHLDRFYLRDTPRVGGYTYRGVAEKA